MTFAQMQAREADTRQRRWSPPRLGDVEPAAASPTCTASTPRRSRRSWLTLKGYSILARRYAAHGGEIDLIARRGRAVAFVEVKARADLAAAADLIGAAKRRRIARAARAWLARNPWAVGFTLRGDAVFVAPGRLPRHQRARIGWMID